MHFKQILMAVLLLVAEQAQAGFCDLVKIVAGSSAVVGGAFLGKIAWTEYQKEKTFPKQLKEKIKKAGDTVEAKLDEFGNNTEKSKHERKAEAIIDDAINVVNKHGKTFGYGVGSLTCVFMGFKLIKSAF